MYISLSGATCEPLWLLLANVSCRFCWNGLHYSEIRLFPKRHLQRIVRRKVKDTQFEGVARRTAWPWNTRPQLTQKRYRGLGKQVFGVCLEHFFFFKWKLCELGFVKTWNMRNGALCCLLWWRKCCNDCKAFLLRIWSDLFACHSSSGCLC